MQNVKIKQNTDKLMAWLDDKIKSDELNNESLIEFIKGVGDYLNIKTIPDYAKEHGLTYQGVKTCRNVQEIFGVKFVIDND